MQGKTLLEDKIRLTLPMEVTESTENYESYDLSEAVWDTVAEAWCFYNLSCQVKDHTSFTLPDTGEAARSRAAAAALVLVLSSAAAALMCLVRHKRKRIL